MGEPGTTTETHAPVLRKGDLQLVHMSVDRVSDRYVAWMNDPEVVRFTESRFATHTRGSIDEFVSSVESDRNSYMWAMIVDDSHIGNIKLGSIDWHHLYADIGLILGSRSHWGRGFGTTAVSLVTEWAFESLSLHKLVAGICDGNTGSVRVFEKADFTVEARQSSHYFLEGEYRDRLIMARFNPRPVTPPSQS